MKELKSKVDELLTTLEEKHILGGYSLKYAIPEIVQSVIGYYWTELHMHKGLVKIEDKNSLQPGDILYLNKNGNGYYAVVKSVEKTDTADSTHIQRCVVYESISISNFTKNNISRITCIGLIFNELYDENMRVFRIK